MDAVNDFCLAGVVLLSLVLPLTAGAALRPGRKPRLWPVWVGQSCLAAAGLLIILSPVGAWPGLALAVVACAGWGWVSHRQLRTA